MNNEANKDEQYWRDQYKWRMQFNDAVDRAFAAIAECREAINAPTPPTRILAYDDMSKEDLLHAIQNELEEAIKTTNTLIELSDEDGGCTDHQEQDIGERIGYQSMSVWLDNVVRDHIRVKV